MYTNINELPQHIFNEMRHFFSVYKELEHKQTAVNEFGGPSDAIAIIDHCIENYKKKFT
jgi:inorganic pyrophosphatase